MRYTPKIHQNSYSDFCDSLSDFVSKNSIGGSATRNYTENQFNIFALEGNFKINSDPTVSLIFKLRINAHGLVFPLHISAPNKESEKIWAPIIRKVLDNLCQTLNSNKKTLFFHRHVFGYEGPKLDGEYWLPGFRISPAKRQDMSFGGRYDDVERIVYIDQEILAATEQLAKKIAISQAKKFAALLSVFLGIGFYDYETFSNHHRWAHVKIGDKIELHSVKLGFVDEEKTPHEMPLPNTSCTSGKFRKANREQIESIYYKLGDTLQCPQDVENLIKKYQKLPEPLATFFLNAACSFQVSLLQKKNFPSSSNAFALSAISALAPAHARKKKKNGHPEVGDKDSIIKTIHNEFPKIEKKYLAQVYERIRCPVSHEGIFPLGEFDVDAPRLFSKNPLDLLKNQFFTYADLTTHNIVRSTLIRWLINK